jgi:hypothetical protein
MFLTQDAFVENLLQMTGDLGLSDTQLKGLYLSPELGLSEFSNFLMWG